MSTVEFMAWDGVSIDVEADVEAKIKELLADTDSAEASE